MSSSLLLDILLERPNRHLLLLRRLIRPMPEFRRRVDPFQIDLLQRFTTRMHKHRFAERDYSLLHARAGAFEDDEVVFHFAVADESAHT